MRKLNADILKGYSVLTIMEWLFTPESMDF